MAVGRLLSRGAGISLALMLSTAPAAVASSVGPGGGPEFGSHVSDMAPDHPLDHGGRHFGACVSGMARGQCPHG
jgi:hypothetical protein